MMENVEASRVRHIDKNDRCAVNKATGRNRSRKCVLHWSVRAARARAALLPSDGFLFRGVLLGQPGVQKQRHRDGLYCSRAEKAPAFAASREWHQAPGGSFDPKRHLRTKSASSPKSCRNKVVRHFA